MTVEGVQTKLMIEPEVILVGVLVDPYGSVCVCVLMERENE